MKKLICLFVLAILVSGCATQYGMNKGLVPTDANALGFLDKLEKSQYAYEKKFNYPYKEVFIASLTVARDWGANIFMKDYDKGTILIQPELIVSYLSGAAPASLGTPGIICGLYIQKVSDKETKVTLKAVRTATYCFASAEDVFINIEKEIQLRRELNE